MNSSELFRKYIGIVNEAMDAEPRHDKREGNRQTLRDQMFGYLDDAQAAIDAGDSERAKEYIGYVIELVDDNV